MIAFLQRFISTTLFLVVCALATLLIILGNGNEENWAILYTFQIPNTDVPLGIFLIALILFIALFIALWATLLVLQRDAKAARYLKKLNDHKLSEKQVNKSPLLLRKNLAHTTSLVETQRKSLQKLSQERTETVDEVTQERIIAERQRLARELHDSVSQQLFAASMLLSALTEADNNNEALWQVEKVVQQAQLEMRALLLHLRPVALKNKTLAQGLNELIAELQQKVSFTIDFSIEEIALKRSEEDHLFRITQEALSNTMRHANATEVELLFIARDDTAILRIQDNGIGFDIEQDKTTSYGLQNIAERAVEIGCTYQIIAVPNEGTIVEVKVPITIQEEENSL